MRDVFTTREGDINIQMIKTLTHVEDIIDVSDLPNGIYILNLTSGKETVVRKIVVES